MEQGGRGDAEAVLRDFLRGVLERMGLTAEVVSTVEADMLTLEIRGAALAEGATASSDEGTDVAGLVIGRKGATLDALQYLAGKVLGRHGAPGLRVVVDAEGYRARRRDALTAIAQQMAERVLRTGEAEETEPLPAHERRVVHLACAEIAGITTRSEGDGDLKVLYVMPAAAGEIDGNRAPGPRRDDPDADIDGNR